MRVDTATETSLSAAYRSFPNRCRCCCCCWLLFLLPRLPAEESYTPNWTRPTYAPRGPAGETLLHTETPCQCESTRLPKPPFPLPNVVLLKPIRKKLYAELETPTYTLAKAPGATRRHSQTPSRCESTRLPKPAFPLPTVAFRTAAAAAAAAGCSSCCRGCLPKKAIPQTEHGHRMPLDGPPAKPSSTPKPLASASRRGYRNHPFHCLTLLLEPIRKKLYAELKRRPYTLAKAPGAARRHSQTPSRCESTRLPKPAFPLPIPLLSEPLPLLLLLLLLLLLAALPAAAAACQLLLLAAVPAPASAAAVAAAAATQRCFLTEYDRLCLRLAPFKPSPGCRLHQLRRKPFTTASEKLATATAAAAAAAAGCWL